MSMKHRMGNSIRCGECKFFREGQEGEKFRSPNDGWCINPKAQGINGRVPDKPKERVPAWHMDGSGCKHWIDAEDGYTSFEVNTGYKEPYDGTKLDFYNTMRN